MGTKMEQLYRVIIVDDEIIARIGIKSLIDWNAFGYCIVGEAENGKKAMELVRRHRPHLVITDIKMPVEDGIGLIQNIKKEGFDSEILVLSAFDDFEYVKKALQLGAFDYLRKLEIEADDLVECLATVKKRLKKRGQQLEGMNAEYSVDKVDVLLQQILRKLLYGTKLNEKQMHALAQCELNYVSDYVVILIRLDVDHENILWRKEVVNNLFVDILSDYGSSYLCETGVDELSVFHSIKSHGGYQQCQELIKMTDRIKRVMKQYLNLEVYVTVSSEHRGLDNIALAYLQAYQAYQMKHMYKKEATLFYKDILIRKSIENYDVVQKDISCLEKALEKDQFPEIKQILDSITQAIFQMEYFEVNHLRYILSSIIYIIEAHFSKLGIDKDTVAFWGDGDKKYLMLESITVKNDFINWVNGLSKSLEEMYLEIDHHHIYILKAKKVLQEQYWKQIRLQDMADQFGMSPNYLSHLFKKETGETFKAYLTTIRIEKAKEKLYQTADTIALIASQVGYENERYFSRVFKEKEGISPSQYRNRKKVHLS